MSELYEEDLSLLSGDILSSFPLFEDVNIYDDLKTELKAADTGAFNPSKDDIDTLVSNLGSLEPTHDDVIPWMENKVNLLDLLMSDGAIVDDSFSVSPFDIPVELPNITLAADSSPCSENTYPLADVESIAIDGCIQTNLNCLDNNSYTVVQSEQDKDELSNQIQQVDTLYGTMDLSICPSSDSGIDLSISDSDQSLLELLPKQLIENLDDPSSISLLLENAVDPAMSFFPGDMDKKDITDGTYHVGAAQKSMSLGQPDEEPSVSSINLSANVCRTPTVSEVMSTELNSQQLIAEFYQNSPMPSSPSSMSSCSSGRSSPYARESPGLNNDASFCSLKSASGSDKIKDKKLRKMRQNKDAATRYRVKKKLESDAVQDECNTLMARNSELKDQVETMTREIAYLKELMADVYQAKQAVKASKHK